MNRGYLNIIETANMFCHNPAQSNAWVLKEKIDRYIADHADAVIEYKEKRHLVDTETRILMDNIIEEYELVKATYTTGLELERRAHPSLIVVQ